MTLVRPYLTQLTNKESNDENDDDGGADDADSNNDYHRCRDKHTPGLT
jgi:hypothetical protein